MPTDNTNIHILSIDHGYEHVKTENTIFPASVTHCTEEPAMSLNKLYWAGHWNAIGEGHKEFLPDKTADEDYLLLTMVPLPRSLNSAA